MNPDEVDITALYSKNLVWDLLPCSKVNEFLPKIGLVPASDEGWDHEHAAHHVRSLRLIPILSVLSVTSRIAGQIIAQAILENQGEEPIFNDADPLVEHYSAVVHQGAVAIIGNLIDQGVLSIGGAY